MKICILPGDGVGHQVTEETVKVLKAAVHDIKLGFGEIGYGCFKNTGTPLPDETIDKIRQSDATLLGAVTTPPDIRNYRSPVVELRKVLDLYANVRPCRNDYLDFTIVRENTEGMYSGIEKIEDSGNRVIAERIVTRKGSERIIRYAFNLAKKMNKRKVTVVHKANVLRKSCGLFRAVAYEISTDFPEIEINELLVDACAMQLIKDPGQFEIIVTTNLFGDILSDEASMLAGGLGVAFSGNIGEEYAVFEPVHGSAPKYVGSNKINPMATVLSAALMLEHAGLEKTASKIQNAVRKCIKENKSTQDLGGTLSTTEVTQAIIDRMN